MIRRPRVADRSGAAAVEFAWVMLFVLVPLMIGTWEMGRFIHVQQVVAGAAREGARLAAQGLTINDNGTPTQIQKDILPASNPSRKPNVKTAIHQYLIGAGLRDVRRDYTDTTVTPNRQDLQLDFNFINPGLSPLPLPPATSPQPAPANGEPYQGVKGQRFTVHVKVNYDRVSWTILGLVKPQYVEYTVEWRMLVDDAFNINTNLPSW